MTYRLGRNQCVECDNDATDKRMVCAEHAPLYDDALMQAEIDRAYYHGTPMDHVTDAVAYMVAGIDNEAQRKAIRSAALYGQGIVAVMKDAINGMRAEFVATDEFYHWPTDSNAEYLEELRAVALKDVKWREIYDCIPIISKPEYPSIPVAARIQDHGHPRSPKASRRKGR